jgi:Fic family protein
VKSEDFCATVSGNLKVETNDGWIYFDPNPLPFDIEPSSKMRDRFSETSLALARLDGKVSGIKPSGRKMLLDAFVVKESALSLAIEGSRSTISDVYISEKAPEKTELLTADNADVRNYRKALEAGIESMSSSAITDEMVLSLHATIMEGARTGSEGIGGYRKNPVVIGRRGDTLETARFVPPPPKKVPGLMENWIRYANTTGADGLMRVALAHYQFEAIHPFGDGNGRTGRLLAMLMMHRSGLAKNPVLYLSEYFNRNRSEYLGLLYGVSARDGFDEWFAFFLDALDAQIRSSDRLMASLEEYREKTREAVGHGNGRLLDVVDLLMENPFIVVKDVMRISGVTQPTAQKTIDKLVDLGILRDAKASARWKVYVAQDVIDMLER